MDEFWRLIFDFLSQPYVFPILYWITYIFAVLAMLSVIFSFIWYSRARKRFSSPMKKSKISSFVIVLLIIIIVGTSQLLLSVFNEDLLFKVSSILLTISLVFQGLRTFTNISFSSLYKSRNKAQTVTNKPLVSLIVPAYNEAKVISKTINSLLQLSYEPKEIIIIDDGSKDDTLKEAQKIAKKAPIRVISKPNGGKWSALNKGIEEAKGEIVVCIDADTTLEKNAIEPLLPYFDNSKVAAVAGNIKVGNRRSSLTKLQALEYILEINLQRRSESTISRITVVPGPLGAFRKSILEEVGMYSGDTFAEDADLTLNIVKAGYKIKFEKKAIGYTEAPTTLLDLGKQRYRWYRGQLQVMKKNVKAFFKVPWIYFNGIFLTWFSFIALLWLLMLMLNPFSSFVIYKPVSLLPGARGRPDSGSFPPQRPLAVSFFETIPVIYIFWFCVFLLIEILVAIYALGIDVKEKPKLALNVFLYKIFFMYLLDIIKIFSHVEEFLNYPMKWEIAQRIGKNDTTKKA